MTKRKQYSPEGIARTREIKKRMLMNLTSGLQAVGELDVENTTRSEAEEILMDKKSSKSQDKGK